MCEECVRRAELTTASFADDGWTESYGMARCYVDFGIGVFDKRSEGGNEKEEKWDIRGKISAAEPPVRSVYFVADPNAH